MTKYGVDLLVSEDCNEGSYQNRINSSAVCRHLFREGIYDKIKMIPNTTRYCHVSELKERMTDEFMHDIASEILKRRISAVIIFSIRFQ